MVGPLRPEDIGAMTIVELLIHPNPEIRKIAQDLVRLLLKPPLAIAKAG